MERIADIHPEGGPLMTKQSMAAETDVNNIIARWIHHGTVPIAGTQPPSYGDFSSAIDFQKALNSVRDAQNHFDELPAHVRRACNNNPLEFLEMAYDPARRDELVKLGLAEELIPEKPAVIDPPTPPNVPVP